MPTVNIDFLSSAHEFKLITPFLREFVKDIKLPKTMEEAIWIHLQSLIISEPNNRSIKKYYEVIEDNSNKETHHSEVILNTFHQSFTVDVAFAKHLSVHDLVAANLLQSMNWMSEVLLQFLLELKVGYVVAKKVWITKNEIRISLKPCFL